MKKLLLLHIIFISNIFSEILDDEIYKKISLEKEMQAQIEQEDLDDFPNPIIISLGYNCTVARKLRDNNLRCYAFPFDWVRSSFSSIQQLLEEDFSDLLNPAYLSFEKAFILNKKYKIAFYKAFPNTQY